MNKLSADALKGFGRAPVQTPLMRETGATIEAAHFLDVPIPYDASPQLIVQGVAGAFMPDEFDPNADKHISPSLKRALTGSFASLRRGAAEGDDRVLAFANRIGRVMAATLEADLMDVVLPMQFQGGTVAVDGRDVPYELQTGLIVEIGLGGNGLFAHLRNLREGKYNIFAINNNRGESSVLRGAADYAGVEPARLQFMSRGIEPALDWLSGREDKRADVVVASRVHMAGRDLLDGMDRVGEILRDGGIVIARGPSRFGKSGYEEVARRLAANPDLETVVDHGFKQRVYDGKPIPNRLIVAQKR